MQFANQTFYLASFVTLLGLMTSFLWGKGSKRDQYAVIYWPLGLGLFAISALGFFLAPWTGKIVLIIANLSLVGGAMSISLLFAEWNKSLTSVKKFLSSAWFLLIGIVYIYLSNAGTTQDRIHLMNVALAAVSLWQLAMLSKLLRTDNAYQIRLLFVVEFIQLCTRVARSVLIIMHPDSGLPSLYQEDILGFALRISSFMSNVVVCILVTNYYLEKLMQEHKKSAYAIEDGMLHSLNALSMVRDNETGNHILRTKNYVHAIASRLKNLGIYTDELSEKTIAQMVKAAPLHDIGKVGIPDNILKKEGSLNPEEWAVMKTHAALGEEVLRAAKVKDAVHTDVLDMAIKIAGGHHESWDGFGYPRGLRGADIPLPARIMSLADMYDALVSERVYKKKWSHEDACAEIIRLKGIRFDPAVVEAFMMERDHFIEIANQYRDETECLNITL